MKNKILNFLKNNKEYIKKRFGVNEIYLAGSYANGSFTKNSDIDIIVDMQSDFDKFFELKYFLEKHFRKEVDLADIKHLRHYIKKNIQKDMIHV